jgi:hypothetical protein
MGLLMKCANCELEALFEYKLTEDVSIFYCGKHLPTFLDERKKAGLLHITSSFTTAKEELTEILKPSEEELPVEEEEVLTTEDEQSAPKKKAAKKKAE